MPERVARLLAYHGIHRNIVVTGGLNNRERSTDGRFLATVVMVNARRPRFPLSVVLLISIPTIHTPSSVGLGARKGTLTSPWPRCSLRIRTARSPV